jgi:sugar (pentulose or hexulose) kinase
MPRNDASVYIGLDVGTSQARASAIDGEGRELAFAATPMPAVEARNGRLEQSPTLWWDAACAALSRIAASIDRSRVGAIAVAGTSGTLLLADRSGAPLGPALMYNDQSSVAESERIRAVAPADSAAQGASAALAKLLQLVDHAEAAAAAHALSQADWIAGGLRERHGIADENNALKLGYDPVRREWPAWLRELGFGLALLPRVVPAGTDTGIVGASVARRFGFPVDTRIVAGTTDSVAAALAAGIDGIGDAVTSLGSTLVLKIVAAQPVTSAAHGVYTHRLGERWLAGGASNTGGAVLTALFDADELVRLSAAIDPERASPLDYYPLARPGERFPINDPTLAPRLAPRPDDDAAYLHGVLEAMARIERDGYRLLQRLGAPYPRRVLSAGGGAANATWRRIRARLLGVPVIEAEHSEAAYGAALLARAGAH